MTSPQPATHSAGAQSMQPLAELSIGMSSRVDLCRLTSGPHAGSLVAVKRLREDVSRDPRYLDAFRDEVWMAAALDHPNIAQVYGWGEDERGPYLAIAFVHGVSLARLTRTVVATGEQFSERHVVYIGSCLAGALAAAHDLQSPSGELLHLVHRDLSPGNVLVGTDGEVKITDFGLAKAKQRFGRTLTGVRTSGHAYMSPEQALGQAIDGRSDIFSLGVLLFELFAQRHPWLLTADEEFITAAIEREPLNLAEQCPKIDKALVGVIHKCLSDDPAKRYQSAAGLQERLIGWLQAHGYRDNDENMGRFVRRNAMKQLRWIDRVIANAASQDGPADDSAPPSSSNEDDGPTLMMRAMMPRSPPEPTRALPTGRRGQLTQTTTDGRTTATRGEHQVSQVTMPSSSTSAQDYGDQSPRPGSSDNRPGVLAPPDSSVPPVLEQPSSPPPAPVRPLPGPLSGDPSTHRRGTFADQLRDTAGQIALQATGLIDVAAQATKLATQAADRAEEAAAAARRVARRGQLASQAAVEINRGLEAAARNDFQTAQECLQAALDLSEQAK